MWYLDLSRYKIDSLLEFCKFYLSVSKFTFQLCKKHIFKCHNLIKQKTEVHTESWFISELHLNFPLIIISTAINILILLSLSTLFTPIWIIIHRSSYLAEFFLLAVLKTEVCKSSKMCQDNFSCNIIFPSALIKQTLFSDLLKPQTIKPKRFTGNGFFVCGLVCRGFPYWKHPWRHVITTPLVVLRTARCECNVSVAAGLNFRDLIELCANSICFCNKSACCSPENISVPQT